MKKNNDLSNNRQLVNILILNYNGWKDTINCLESIFRNSYKNYIVTVIDNGSADNSMDHIGSWAEGKIIPGAEKDFPLNDLFYPPVKKPVSYEFFNTSEINQIQKRKKIPRLTLIQTGANLGFAGGINHGIQLALKENSDYVWLLNNDTLITKDSLNELVRVSNESGNSKITGSVLYYANDPSKVQAWGGGRINFFSGTTRHLTAPGNVDYLTGASLLIPAGILTSVGCLDEGFFLYWEDADFSMRAKKSGWGLEVAEKSILYHKHNTAAKSAIKDNSNFGDIQTSRGIVRFFFKHWGFLALIPVTSRIIRGIFRRIKKGTFKQFPVLIKTMWNAMKNIKKSV